MAEPIVFTFSTAVVAIPFVVAMIALVVSLVLCFVVGKKAAASIALLVALVAGGVFGPAMMKDQVIVSSEMIEQRTGFAWAQTVKGFRFADVEFVRVTQKRVGSAWHSSMIWEIHEKNSGSRDLDPGDLWESNSEEIVVLLKKHGVQFD